jgi:hypothetical protein
VRTYQCVKSSVHVALQTCVNQLGLGHGYSAHPMRATLISTVLEHGAKLEDVQRMVGHADLSTSQLYDRRRFRIMMSAALGPELFNLYHAISRTVTARHLAHLSSQPDLRPLRSHTIPTSHPEHPA